MRKTFSVERDEGRIHWKRNIDWILLVKQRISRGLSTFVAFIRNEGDSRASDNILLNRLNDYFNKDGPLIRRIGYVKSKTTLIIFKGSCGQGRDNSWWILIH